jgi:hypothetical protein
MASEGVSAGGAANGSRQTESIQRREKKHGTYAVVEILLRKTEPTERAWKDGEEGRGRAEEKDRSMDK